MNALHTSCLTLSVAALAWSAGCAKANQAQLQAQSPADHPVQITSANLGVIEQRSDEPTSLALPPDVERTPPKETAGTPIPVADPTGTPLPTRAMSDGEIAGVLAQIIDGELNEARVASKRTKNVEVLRLADRIATDEGAAGSELTALEARHPMVSQSTKAIEDERLANANALANLRGTGATDVDEAYFDAQIAETARVLTLLDDTLIPVARGTELESEVTSVRATIAAHAKLAEEARRAYREHHAATTSAPLTR